MSAQAWDQAKLEIWLVVILFAMFIAGCSTMTPPSLMDEFENNQLSDLGILRYSHKILDRWGVRSVNTELMSTGGAISVAALSTGAVAATSYGAGSGAVIGLAAGVNFLLQALGVIKPDARTNSFSEGGALILSAESEYFINLTSKKIYHVPTNRVTPSGAILLQKTNAAVTVVSRAMVGLLPKLVDLQTLQSTAPPPEE